MLLYMLIQNNFFDFWEIFSLILSVFPMFKGAVNDFWDSGSRLNDYFTLKYSATMITSSAQGIRFCNGCHSEIDSFRIFLKMSLYGQNMVSESPRDTSHRNVVLHEVLLMHP